MASESANEFMIQAIPHRTPPTKITIRGPYLSTNQPSIGTSHVSNSTNSVNATWIAARSQPNFFWMSGTKNVQPYCRLAIITMQTTPMMSCTQGDAKNDLVGRADSIEFLLLVSNGSANYRPVLASRPRRRSGFFLIFGITYVVYQL